MLMLYILLNKVMEDFSLTPFQVAGIGFCSVLGLLLLLLVGSWICGIPRGRPEVENERDRPQVTHISYKDSWTGETRISPPDPRKHFVIEDELETSSPTTRKESDSETDSMQHTFQIMNGTREPEFDICFICRGSTTTGVIASPECGHVSHHSCLLVWLETQKESDCNGCARAAVSCSFSLSPPVK